MRIHYAYISIADFCDNITYFINILVPYSIYRKAGTGIITASKISPELLESLLPCLALV